MAPPLSKVQLSVKWKIACQHLKYKVPLLFFANTFTHGININRVKATVMHNFQDYLLRQLSRLKSSSETGSDLRVIYSKCCQGANTIWDNDVYANITMIIIVIMTLSWLHNYVIS